MPETDARIVEATVEKATLDLADAPDAAAAVQASFQIESDAPTEAPLAPLKAPRQAVRVAAALALLLGGLPLIASSISFLHVLVIPMSALGLTIGLIAVIASQGLARRRLVLPGAASAVCGAMLVIAWFFPELLGPAYEFSRRVPESARPELHAIPLAGAPELTELPDWVDGRRYALERDGLRVQVIRVAELPQLDKNSKAPVTRLVIGVRISRHQPEDEWIERQDQPVPTLTDETGKQFALLETEFFDRGGASGKPGLLPFPTIEETFVFAVPPPRPKSLHLELPAAHWKGTGVFRFSIPSSSR